MTCERCQQREARVRMTIMADGVMSHAELCEECAGVDISGDERMVAQLASSDPRYSREAYVLVREAVKLASNWRNYTAWDPPATALKILENLQTFASRMFGADAKAGLAKMGITRSED